MAKTFRGKVIIMDEQIQQALEVLKKGGLILYPTDTVWGIGCDATNAAAVERIYALKRRVEKLSMIILTDNLDNVVKYVRQIPGIAEELFSAADKPLTLILPDGVGVAPNILPEEKTVAIRIPKHDFCKKLIYKLRRPLVSTSANVSGEPTPLSFAQISEEIKQGVDFIVDPSLEKGSTGKPSSIIKLGMGGEFEIIRP